MKHKDAISQMSLEERCYLFSDKDFWQTRSVERLGIPNMTLSDGPHGMGIPEGLAPTLANIVNILMQVIITYPTMKFWVMPDEK